MECGENMSQVYNSQLEITASEDSVEFNYNLRKSLLAQENESFEKNSSSNKTINFEHSIPESPNITGENGDNNISQQEEEISESHEQEIVFVDAKYDETMNATFTEDYDPLGAEVSYSDPLNEQSDTKEVTENETVEATVSQEARLGEAEEMSQGVQEVSLRDVANSEYVSQKNVSFNQSVNDLDTEVDQAANNTFTEHLSQVDETFNETSPEEAQTYLNKTSETNINPDKSENQLNQTFDQAKESNENFKGQTCLNQTIEVAEAKTCQSSEGQKQVDSDVRDSINPPVCLNVNKTFDQSEDLGDVKTEPQACLNQTIEEAKADSSSLNGKNSVDQVEELKPSLVEGDFNTEPSVSPNETTEATKAEGISQISNRIKTEQAEGPETSCDEKSLVIEPQSGLIGDRSSLNGKYSLNQTFDEAEGSNLDIKPMVCLNETIEVTKVKKISLDVKNELNQTFEESEVLEISCNEKVMEHQSCLNQTIEEAKADEILLNGKKSNERLDVVERSEESLDKGDSIIKLNKTIEVTEAEEISQKSSSKVQNQLNQTFEQVEGSDGRGFNNKSAICLNTTIEDTKAAEISHKSSSNVHNKLDQTFEQAEASETSCNEKELVNEPQSCSNQTIEKLDQVEGLEKSPDERGLAITPRVSLDKTIEEILQKSSNEQNTLNETEGLETKPDGRGCDNEPPICVNATIEVIKAEEISQKSSPNLQNQLNGTFEQVEGSNLDAKGFIMEPAVCLNATIEVTEAGHILQESLLKVGNQLNQTFEESGGPETSCTETVLVTDPQSGSNETIEVKTEDISQKSSSNEHIALNQTFGETEELETKLDERSCDKPPICLNETIEVIKAEEISQKASPNLQNQLNQVEESETKPDKRDFNSKPEICLNSTIEVTEVEKISLKSSPKAENHLNQTFEQSEGPETSCNETELVTEPQSCLNQMTEVAKIEDILQKSSSNEESTLNQTFDEAKGSETNPDGAGCDNKLPICLNATIEVTKAEEHPQKSLPNLQNHLDQTFEQETSCNEKELVIEPQSCLNQTIKRTKADSSSNPVNPTLDQVEVLETRRDLNLTSPVCLNKTIEVTKAEEISEKPSPKVQNQLNQTFEQAKGPETSCDNKDLIIEPKSCLNQTIEVEKPESSKKFLSDVANQTYHQADDQLDTRRHNFEEPMDVSYSENSFSTTNAVNCTNVLISEVVERTNSEGKGQLTGTFGHDNHLKQNESSEEPMDISYCENGSSDAKISHDCLGHTTQVPSSTNNQTFGNESVTQINEQKQTSKEGISDQTTVESDNVCLNKTIEMADVVHVNQTFETDNHLIEQKNKDSGVVNQLHKEELNLTSTKKSNEEPNQTVSIPKDSTDSTDLPDPTVESAITDQSKEEPRHSISGRRSVNFSSVISTDMPINSSCVEDDVEVDKAMQVLAQSMNKTIDAEESAIVEEISSTDDSCNLDATFDGNKCIQWNRKEAKKAVNLQPDAKPEESKPEIRSSTEACEIKPSLSNKIECRPNIRALRNKTQVIQIPTILKAAEIDTEAVKSEAEAKMLEELKIREDELKNEKSRMEKELDELEKDNRKKDQCILEHALEGEVWKSTLEKYRRLSEQYDKHLRKQTRELEEQRKSSEGLAKDFASTEMAFSVAMQRYEKAKCIIEAYQKNEEIMKQNLQNAGKAMFELEAKCEGMKAENKRVLEETEKNLAQEKRNLKTSLNKLQSSYKRLEIKAQALESALSERTKECAALAALCDEMTAGQS